MFDKEGSRTHYPDAGLEPEYFNTTAEAYWELIEARGIPIARVDQEHAIADPYHQWGPAYFHYVPSTYQAQLEAITVYSDHPEGVGSSHRRSVAIRDRLPLTGLRQTLDVGITQRDLDWLVMPTFAC